MTETRSQHGVGTMSCLRAASDVMAPKLTLRFDMAEGVWIGRRTAVCFGKAKVELSHGHSLLLSILTNIMDEEETELRNPFPSPPSHYQNYTTHNLKLLSLLRERAEPEGIDLSNVNQLAILSDQSDVPEWPLAQLEKPRVDWILEEGSYTVFGDTWQVNLVSLLFSIWCQRR